MRCATAAWRALLILTVILWAALPVQAAAQQKRLSDWLLEQPRSADAYPLGLSWRVPDEVPAQLTRKLGLLKMLAGDDAKVKIAASEAPQLRAWLQRLPVTGRVPLAVADPYWLQANPTRDPVLLPGHSVVLPSRPRTVTVVMPSGELCQVLHAPGTELMGYVSACSNEAADWAWVAQPDGRVQRFGIALWNRETQDEPAPGAWIWAPSRKAHWPERFSDGLVEFLATQGPAADLPGAVSAAPAVPRPGGTSDSLSRTLATEPGAYAGREPGQGAGAAAPSKAAARPPAAIEYRSRSLETSTDDWGEVGLLQTPTARMNKAGALNISLTNVYPYTRANIFVQPFEWLEAGFRYTNISNRPYGPPELSGSQAAKDKSFDFKLRLSQESALWPGIALGLRDVTGTGLFSSQYFVGSKRTGDFDWSLGLGWGYMVGHPPSINIGEGGNFSIKSYFSGPMAPFGGVQYHTPWQPLTLKLEYDANNYQNEPDANPQPQRSHLNLGLAYRLNSSVDFNLGFERGNTLMLGIALHAPLDALYMPKLNDPPRLAVAAGRPSQNPDWAATSRDIATQTGWRVASIEQTEHDLDVVLSQSDAMYRRERLDRAVSVLHRDAPESVDRFRFTYRDNGIDTAETVVDRDAWTQARTQPLPPSAEREPFMAQAPAAGPARGATTPANSGAPPLYTAALPRFESGLGINYQQQVGGPDAFILYQLGVIERAKWRLRDDTWLQGSLLLGLIDNYDKFKYDAPSELPRVRTYVREYVTTSKLTMPNLQLTHVGQLTENQYYSVYGGYLESMFAGVGAEWLYRPFGSRVAYGVDVNEVKQRNFSQDFGFDEAGTQTGYHVATGHATLYWDTGWQGLQAYLSAGRYLAGDTGVTVQAEKTFNNGVSVGGFFTKTNVSAAQFGEGSFDKGLYLRIPFDAFLTRSSDFSGTFLWKPLTRDGGAKLAREISLYDFTSKRDPRAFEVASAPAPNNAVPIEDRREAWQPAPHGPEPFTHVAPQPSAEQWSAGSGRYEERLTEALYTQGFRDIQLSFDASHRLALSVSNSALRPASRAVGRAARTALALAPLDTREIRVEFIDDGHAVLRYDFIDLARLSQYFDGRLDRSGIAGSIAVSVIDPSWRDDDPLAQLADIDTDAAPRSAREAFLPDMRGTHRVLDDFRQAGQVAKQADWLKGGLWAGGLVLTAAALDKRADQFARDHADSSWMKHLVTVGDALPVLAMGGAVAAALDKADPVLSRTGYAAAEAGATAYLTTVGLRYAVGRSRPENELGPSEFKPFSGASGYDSFPSGHTVVSWAVATPFAEEYQAPWLYGVASLTNLARVGSRQHWLSDTVAASALGYGMGRIFLQAARNQGSGPRLVLGAHTLGLAWALP
jgi:membrane-associated phospholipid phosphatase